jgi:hypothetical protein
MSGLKMFCMPEMYEMKVDNSTLSHYRLGPTNPMNFWRFAIFEKGAVTRAAIGHYETTQLYWIAEPLQWVTFKKQRPPGLLLRGIDYKLRGIDSFYVVVATPPFKKKANLKSESELVSYVLLSEVLNFSTTVPADIKDIALLVKGLCIFKEIGVGTVEEMADFMTAASVPRRIELLEELHEARVKSIFQAKNCQNDAAMAPCNCSWKAHGKSR